MLKFRLPCAVCVLTALVLEILPFGITLAFDMGALGTNEITFSYFNATLISHGIFTAFPSAIMTALAMIAIIAQIIWANGSLEKFIPIIIGLAFLLTLFVLLRHSLGVLSILISIFLFIAFVLAIVPFVLETKRKYRDK